MIPKPRLVVLVLVSSRIQTVTLTLKILLQTLKGDVSRRADNKYAKDALDISAESFLLSEDKKHWFYEGPKQPDRDEQSPQNDKASLKMKRDI